MKKFGIIIVALCAALTLTGCMGNNNGGSNTSEDGSAQNGSQGENTMGSEGMSGSEGLGGNENGSQNGQDAMGFGASEEENAYQSWSQAEQNNPAMDENGIRIPLSELLTRANELETFIASYPNSAYREDAMERYQEIMTAVITGGYDNKSDDTHMFLSEDRTMIAGSAIEEYDAFVSANGDTKTAALLEEYTTILGNEERAFSDAVMEFYDKLPDSFNKMFK